MKTIKQIREEYDNIVLDQVQIAPDELVLEGRESAVKASSKAIPSPNEMPTMLMFRRIAYRTYPNKQTVALYYSKYVNKYLSIPFGPDGNLNLSEAVVLDTIDEGAMLKAIGGGIKGAAHGAVRGVYRGSAIAAEPGIVVGGLVGAGVGAYKGAKRAYQKAKEQEKKDMNEDWQSVNRNDKTDGLSQKAVNAYRRENPGSKLKTAVTEKNPTGKRASRRKSFCSRMGGMKKRLTSAKTARDPDSNINKALRRWNCEEQFRSKLSALREERMEENIGAAISLVRSAAPAVSRVAKNLPAIAAGAGEMVTSGARQAANVGRNVLSKFKKSPSKTPPKSSSRKTPPDPKAKLDAGDAAKFLDKAAPKKDTAPDGGEPAMIRRRGDLLASKQGATGKSSKSFAPHSALTPTQQSKYTANLLAKENKISDIQNMVNEGYETMDLSINGRSITLNNSMAKRILEVYDSVNTKNKKIVESMINEDLESFKKLLNFSIKV